MLYTRVPRLFADLELAHGDGRFARLFRTLVKVLGLTAAFSSLARPDNKLAASSKTPARGLPR